MLCLADHANEAGESWPSHGRIAAECGLRDPKNVAKIVKRILVPLGEVVEIPGAGSSGRRGGVPTTRYRITLSPISSEERKGERPAEPARRRAPNNPKGVHQPRSEREQAELASSPKGVHQLPQGGSPTPGRGFTNPLRTGVHQPPESPCVTEQEPSDESSGEKAETSEGNKRVRLHTEGESQRRGEGATADHLSDIDSDTLASEARQFIRLHGDKGEEKFWKLLRASRKYSPELRGEAFAIYAPIRRREAKRRAAGRHGETPGLCVSAGTAVAS